MVKKKAKKKATKPTQTGNRPRRALDRSTWRGELGARIRDRRDACGYTLYEAAELVGVTHGTLYQIETAKTSATLPTLVAICKALSIHPSALLEGIDFRK